MLTVGVACGLVTAVFQALAYLFSRRYSVVRHGSALRLMVVGHAVMGLICAAALPALAWGALPPLGSYALDSVMAGVYYFVGQVGLFAALRRMDASRVAPLLGLKVVFVALVAMAMLGQVISALQWLAVGIASAAAFMLNRIGGRLPVRVVFAVLAACLLFAISDVHTKKVIDAMSGIGTVRGPITAAAVNYLFCGLLSAALLPWYGSRRAGDWTAALPYIAAWLSAVVLLFISYAYAGIVLAGIAMATRGLWSIVVGAMVSRAGHHHIEQHVSRPVLLRRIGAAVMMLLAIALYTAAQVGWI